MNLGGKTFAFAALCNRRKGMPVHEWLSAVLCTQGAERPPALYRDLAGAASWWRAPV